MYCRILTLILCLCLVSCKLNQRNHIFKLEEYQIPPGTIKIGYNLYMDMREVINLSYIEFIFWTKHTYGEKSKEYLSIQPRQDLWNMLGEKYSRLSDWYLGHPAYRNYPVVNITYEQAVRFSEWRSDRVMEYILISEKIIPYNNNTDNDNYFTIKKYFTGNYKGMKPDPRIIYYPWYTLPDSAEFMTALKKQDTLNKLYKSYYLRKEIDTEVRCFENLPDKNDILKYGIDPTRKTTWLRRRGSQYICKKNFFVDIQGNVREFMKNKNYTFGLSYLDSCSNQKKTICTSEGPNCYTGFRNLCSYMPVETLIQSSSIRLK